MILSQANLPVGHIKFDPILNCDISVFHKNIRGHMKFEESVKTSRARQNDGNHKKCHDSVFSIAMKIT